MTGVVFLNPDSGSAATGPDALREAFPHSRIEPRPPDELAEGIQAAVDAGEEFIGVAGGDGTLRTGAQVLVGGTVPLLAIPAGTRNHFAKELGLDTVKAASRAARGGRTRTVDVGEVNGHCFLNNSSIGLYPQLVVERQAAEGRLPKRLADAVALLRQVRETGTPMVLDGERHRAWMVFVGNGRYGQGLTDLVTRESLEDHILDVRLIRSDARWARLRIFAALALGRVDRSPLLVGRCQEAVEVGLDGPTVEVALDGEVETLSVPLRYRNRPSALTVLVPPDEEP